jgi:thiamine phosphate synthase YjbQ (UPF0047 family)
METQERKVASSTSAVFTIALIKYKIMRGMVTCYTIHTTCQFIVGHNVTDHLHFD